jgi:hypothetical protein
LFEKAPDGDGFHYLFCIKPRSAGVCLRGRTGRPRLDEVQGRSASLALHSGSTAPTMPVLPVALFGALRQSRRPLLIFPGGFAVNITGVCHGHSKRLR